MVALDNVYGAVVLVVIKNPGSVILVESSPEDYEGNSAVLGSSAVIDGSGAVFLIVVVENGTGAVVVYINVAVFSWYLITVILLAVGFVAFTISFVVVSVDIVEI